MPKFPSTSVSSSPPAPVRASRLLDRAQASYYAGNRADARSVCERVLRSEPTNVQALNLLGITFAEEHRFHDAMTQFDSAIQVDPRFGEAWRNRGLALLDFGFLAEALASFEQVIAWETTPDAGLMLRAITLARMGRFEEAVLAYDQILARAGMTADVAANRGIALLWSGRMHDAMASFDQAIELDPDLPNPRLNKAMMLLLAGDLPNGGKLYEWRRKMKHLEARRTLTSPLWLGETSIAGKTIFLYYEQGLGDTIHFCRYATQAAKAGARVILEVQQPLKALMETLPGVAQVLTDSDEVPDHDLHSPLMSLPLAFGTTLDTIPAEVPYLHADPSRAAVWRDRLSDLQGRRVGLVWAGFRRFGHAVAVATDHRRSLSLEALAPLASVAGCSFVSLQLGPPAAEAKSLSVSMFSHDYTDELNDFADTAALIENLDLVICADTAVVHLAGAMGKPVWLLNRFDTCWRWFLDRDDSPWYPTLHQFRQTESGDWAGVINRVRDALTAFVADGHETRLIPESQ